MILDVKVILNARKPEIEVKPDGSDGKALVVARLTEPPEKNRANLQLLKLLRVHYGMEARLVAGAGSRKKIIELL